MKKICTLFYMCLILLLTSCNKKSIEEKVFDEFLNSDNLYSECYLTIKESGTEVKQNIFNFLIWEEGMKITIPESKIVFTLDVDKERLIYSNVNTRNYIYTDIDDTVEEENEDELDIDKYIKNLQYNIGEVSFDFDINLLYKEFIQEEEESNDVEVLNIFDEFEELEELEPIKIVCYIKDNKVEKIDINLEKLLKKYIELESFILSLENVKYEKKLEVPNIDYDLYNNVTNEEFYTIIISDFMPQEEEEEPSNPEHTSHYDLYTDIYYMIETGDNFELNGYLIRDNSETIELEDCEITYTPNIDLSILGETTYTAKVSYDGKEFSKKITIFVYCNQKSNDEINLDSITIHNIFVYENYLLIADKTYLYKYNLLNKKIEGKVDLKCMANSFFIKDEYLYVSANYPYTTLYLDDEAFDGTISKIKFDEFELVNNMHVDFLPYSIIVDNRDDIIVSMGSKYADGYQKIDLEKNTYEKIIGFVDDQDYLIYNSEKDAILSITQTISSDNYWNYYQNNSYNNYSSNNPSSSFSGDKVSYITPNQKTILTDYYGSVIVGRYNEDIEDYVSEAYQLDNSFGDLFINKYYYYNNKVYALKDKEYSNIFMLEILDIDNNKSELIYLDINNEAVQNFFIYDDKLYIVYDKATKIEIYDLN